MKCQDCDAEVTPGSKFCPKCGARVEGEPEQQGEAQPPAKTSPAERIRGAATPEEDDDDDDGDDRWTGGYCGKAMIGYYILGGMVSIGVIVLGFILNSGTWWLVLGIAIAVMWLAIGLCLAYRKLDIKYELNDRRFIHRSGILRRREDRIETIDMDDVVVEQGLLERMVGVGTITIHSSDASDPELVMPGIENAKDVAQKIDRIRRKERRRRGLHIESV